MTRLQIALVLVAAIATIYATASFLTGFDADFEVATVTAVLALGAVIWVQYVADERERRP